MYRAPVFNPNTLKKISKTGKILFKTAKKKAEKKSREARKGFNNLKRKTRKFVKNPRKSKKNQNSNGSKTDNNISTTSNNNSKTANAMKRNTDTNNSMTANAMERNTGNNNSMTANAMKRNTGNNNSMTANAMERNTVITKKNNASNNAKLVEKDDRPCHERFSIKSPRDYVRVREGPRDKDGNPQPKAGKGMVISSATSWERVKESKPPRMKWGCKYYIKYDDEKEQKLDDIMLHQKPVPEEYLEKIGSEPVKLEETSEANNNGSNGSKAKNNNGSKAKNNNGSKANNNNGSNSFKAKNTSHEIKNDKGETISEMIKRIKAIQNKLFIERKQKSEKNSDIFKPCNIKDLEKEIKELFTVYKKKNLKEGSEYEKKLYKYIFF